jgi:hypothetical protein
MYYFPSAPRASYSTFSEIQVQWYATRESYTPCTYLNRQLGAPTLIFVTGAALRVADVTRVLKDKQLRGEKGGEVAKLFAKHFKLEEHVTYLKRTKVGAAVGTPGRIGKLLCETGKLLHLFSFSFAADGNVVFE